VTGFSVDQCGREEINFLEKIRATVKICAQTPISLTGVELGYSTAYIALTT
jgi:hypothetical protein